MANKTFKFKVFRIIKRKKNRRNKTEGKYNIKLVFSLWKYENTKQTNIFICFKNFLNMF